MREVATLQPGPISGRSFALSRTRWARPLGWALIVALHAALALSFLRDRSPGTDAAASGFPLDDAWIHLVYGREIALHGRPDYNTGELQAGFTSPLWLAATSFSETLKRVAGLDPVMVLKSVGVLSAAGASLTVFELSLGFTGSLPASLALGLLAAGMPLVAFSQLSGMEANLASAVMLAAILALQRRKHLLSGAFGALAYLARPESVVLAPLLLGGLFLAESTAPSEAKGMGRGTRALLCPLFFAAAAWAIFCLAVNGHPLPNTFYAKASGVQLAGNLRHVFGEIFLGLPMAHGLVGAAVYAVGVAVLLRGRSPAGLVVSLLPWTFAAAVAASRPMPAGCGTYYYWWRYVLPALPGLFVPAAVGVGELWRLAGGTAPWSARTAGGLRKIGSAVVFGAVLFVALSQYRAQLGSRREQFSWNCQNINEVQVAFGRWVKAAVAPEAAVLVNDAGAIRYFGERRTVDLTGLNNHRLLFDPESRALKRDPRRLGSYMSAQRATHLIIFPSWFPALGLNPAFFERFQAVARYSSGNYTVSGGTQDAMIAFRLLP